jgi:hypothetical protein
MKEREGLGGKGKAKHMSIPVLLGLFYFISPEMGSGLQNCIRFLNRF